MAKSVATVWVPVDDMERAVAFYTETLGFTATQQSSEWSEIDAGNLTIGLNGREETAVHSAGGAVITFTPEGDIESEVQRLTAAGVDFTDGISDHPWGRIVPFKDSEGNDLQLYGPPSN